jgi:hypothetical protein
MPTMRPWETRWRAIVQLRGHDIQVEFSIRWIVLKRLNTRFHRLHFQIWKFSQTSETRLLRAESLRDSTREYNGARDSPEFREIWTATVKT